MLNAAHVVSIPLRTRFRGITTREAMIFDAPAGPSEWSPFLEYDDVEAATWLESAIEFGWGDDSRSATGDMSKPRHIEVNATVPAVPAEHVSEVLARFPGCHTAKVKVAEPGGTLDDDLARVRTVRDELRRAHSNLVRVRIDANGAWSVAQATRALTAFAEAGIEIDYAEQPCASIAELAELRQALRGRGIETRIAADESVRKAADPLAVARAGAADVLVIKAQPLGGVSRAREIVVEAGLPVVVSSALDTSVGISMGLWLAASLPAGMLDGACGLGTAALLTGDVVADPLTPHVGALPVDRPVLDSDALARWATPPERDAWWRERLARCYNAIAR